MSSILIHILKTVFGAFILNIVGVNIVGFAMRSIGGVFRLQQLREKVANDVTLSDAAKSAIGRVALRMSGARVFSMACIGLQFGFVYFLYRQWGWLMAIAGCVVMLDRLPDLLDEMETGSRVLKPRAPAHVFLSLCINFVLIPVLVWMAIGHSNK